jgi:hypothetical protein
MAHVIGRDGIIASLLAEYRQELEGLTDEELLVYLHALQAVEQLPDETWHRRPMAETWQWFRAVLGLRNED